MPAVSKFLIGIMRYIAIDKPFLNDMLSKDNLSQNEIMIDKIFINEKQINYNLVNEVT